MYYQDQGPHAGEVGGPGEHHQGNGCVVVDEHLPEVLPFYIKELTDDQRPVEGQLHHVVQPDVWVNLGMLNINFTRPSILFLPCGKDNHTNSNGHSTTRACTSDS